MKDLNNLIEYYKKRTEMYWNQSHKATKEEDKAYFGGIAEGFEKTAKELEKVNNEIDEKLKSCFNEIVFSCYKFKEVLAMDNKQKQEYINNLELLKNQIINNIDEEIKAAQNEKNDYCEPEKLHEKLSLILNKNKHLLDKRWY